MAESTLSLGLRIRLDGATAAANGVHAITSEIGTLGQRATQSSAALNQIDGGLGRVKDQLIGFAAMATSAFAVTQMVKMADTWTNLEGRLKLVTASSEELYRTQQALFASSNANRVGLESTIELYAKMARNQKELNVTTQDMIGLVDTIGKTLVISGGSAESANLALLQFSQSMGSGILNGEEFRSVGEQAPRLLRAIAEGWLNVDGTIGTTGGKLRALALNQALTMDKVIPAIQRAGKTVAYEFSQMPLTIGQSLTVAENHLLKFIGVTGQTSGAAQAIATSIIAVGEHIDAIAGMVLGAAGAWLVYNTALLGVDFVAFVGRIQASAATTVAYSEALAINNTVNLERVATERAVALAVAQSAEATASSSLIALNAQRAQLAYNATLITSNLSLARSELASATSTAAKRSARAEVSSLTRDSAVAQALLNKTIAAQTAAQARYTTALAATSVAHQESIAANAAMQSSLTALYGETVALSLATAQQSVANQRVALSAAQNTEAVALENLALINNNRVKAESAVASARSVVMLLEEDRVRALATVNITQATLTNQRLIAANATLTAVEAERNAVLMAQTGAQIEAATASRAVTVATTELTAANVALTASQAASATATTFVSRSLVFLKSLIPALRAELVALNAVALANPYALAITAIAAAGTALYWYRDQLIAVNGTQAELRDYAQVAWDKIAGFAGLAWHAISDDVATRIEVIKTTVSDLVPAWFGTLDDLVNGALATGKALINIFIGIEKSIGDIVTSPFRDWSSVDFSKTLARNFKTDYLTDMGIAATAVGKDWSALANGIKQTRDEAEALAKQKDLAFKLGLQPQETTGLNFSKKGAELLAKYAEDLKKATLSVRELGIEEIKASGATGKEYDFLVSMLDKKLAAEKANGAETKTAHNQESDLLKNAADLQKALTDARIADIKRLTDATLSSFEMQKTVNDNLYADYNISAQRHYEQEIALIDKITAAKVEALRQQSAAQAVATGSQLTDLARLHAAILQQESRGDLTAVNPSSGALGGMQVLPSTLRNPGYGIVPFQPAIDQNLSNKTPLATLKAFTTQYQNELKTFGENYFDALVKNLGSVDAAIQQYGDHTKAYQADIYRLYGDINGSAADSVKLASQQKDIEAQIAQAIAQGEHAKADALRTYQKADADYLQSVDAIKVKYIELTGTLHEAFLAKQNLETSKDPLLKQAQARGDTGTVDLIKQTSAAELAQFDTKNADDFKARLLDINKGYEQIGLTSSQAFDLMNKGAGGVAQAFSGLTDALSKVNEAILQNGLDAQKVTTDHTLTEQQKYQLSAAYAQKAIKLENEKTSTTLTGTRQIVGAVGSMFGENTKARKAFHAVEMTLGALELATNLANNGAAMASNLVMIGSNIATGASKIWAQMGIFAPIGLAVMAASLVAWGAGAFGGGNSVQPPKESPTTGTVLGDSSQQSESITNLMTLLKDIHASEYAQLQGINKALGGIQSGITQTVTKLFQSNTLSTSLNTNPGYSLLDSLKDSVTPGKGLVGTLLSTAIGTGINLMTSAFISGAGSFFGNIAMSMAAGPIGFLVGGLFSVITSLFSGGYSSLMQKGIDAPAQTAGDIKGNGYQAQQYELYKVRGWDWISDWTSYPTYFGKLGDEILGALTSVFTDASDSVGKIAKTLGLDVEKQIADYKFPALRVDLKDLKADEAGKKISAAINTMLDGMVNSVLGDAIGHYQQVGEGILETAGRLASEITVVKNAFLSSRYAITGDVIAISDSLVQLSGGLKQFNDAFAAYYDKFYSAEEKQSRLKNQLAAILTDAGMWLPDTRAGYRTLVDSLDPNNQKDRERYTLLLQVSDAADQYYAALENSIQTYDSIRNYLDSLKLNGALTTLTPEQRLAEAGQHYASTLASARLGNDKAVGTLTTVADAYLKEARSFYASSQQYALIFAQVTQALEQFTTTTPALKPTPAVASVDGSHRNGLDYVPFDGYRAELHQGERVQTKAQARAADNDNRAALVELRENNRLLREQNARLEQLIKVSQFGFKGVINVEENVVSALDDIEQRLWKNETA